MLILRYNTVVKINKTELYELYSTLFKDANVSILEFHWNTEKQMILLSFGKRRQLSINKWSKILRINWVKPYLLSYEKRYF